MLASPRAPNSIGCVPIFLPFRFGPRVLLQGLLMALTMGVLGGLFPALRAVRLNIVSALREQ